MRRLLCFALLGGATAFGLSGCLSVNWTRTSTFVAPSSAALDRLEPGVSTLDECLAKLGAPLFVWEYKGDGVALAYGSSDVTGAGVRVSIPVAESASVSLDYDQLRAKLRGAVLFFDPTLKLELVRRGYLRDIDGGTARRRPAAVPAVPAGSAPDTAAESATNES